MHTDKSNLNNQKPHGKPIDAGERDKNVAGQVDKPSDDGGMKETRPGPGSEVPGQVAKM